MKIDGVEMKVGDRILLTSQSTRRRRFWRWLTRKPKPAPENGIYQITRGTWTR